MSYVGLEKKCCPICVEIHDHECGILMDTKFKDLPEGDLITGYKLCKRCEEQSKTHLALIEITNQQKKEKLKLDEIERTGRYVFLDREYAEELFGDSKTSDVLVFVDTDLINMLMAKASTTH